MCINEDIKMKAILMSIHPKWCNLIASGTKTIEVRKTAPKDTPFKVYIYQTKYRGGNFIVNEALNTVYGGGKVIGEFVCDKVIKTCGWRLRGNTGWCAKRTEAEEKFPTSACLTIDEIVEYAGGEGREVSGWHISDLKIYDKPKELGMFLTPNGTGGVLGNHYLSHPPRSWQYVEPYYPFK